MAEGESCSYARSAAEITSLATNSAPATDDTLTPDDAGKILEELLEAQNHAQLLALAMKVNPRDVETIHATYQQPKDRLLHIIIAFLRQSETRPTWRVIVDALRSPAVNLPALARRVEAAHFPDPTAIVLPEYGKSAIDTLL